MILDMGRCVFNTLQMAGRLHIHLPEDAVRKGWPMNSQVDFVERREHPRVGVMAQLEDVTYRALRKHGVVSEPDRARKSTPVQTQ